MYIAQLLFILFLTVGLSWKTPEAPERRPQSMDEAQHLFWLASGTQGCPSRITWQKQTACRGFELYSTDRSTSISFCAIGEPAQEKIIPIPSGRKRIISQATREDNVIRQTEKTIMHDNNNEITLTREDLVILDDTGKFLWERNHNGHGFSCLYSK